MHDDYPRPVPSKSDSSQLAQLAARHESASVWLAEFSAVLASGAVAFTRYPGTEFAVRIPPVPFSEDAGKAALFCTERQLAAPPNTAIMFDLSAICSTDMRHWLDVFLQGVPAGLRLSIAADHPAAPVLLRGPGTRQLNVRYSSSLQGAAWRNLVAVSYADHRIRPVPALQGRTLTALHAPERGLCAMPCGMFETAPDTAWCLLELDAALLGEPLQLRRQLAVSLRLADNLLDEVVWPRPALQLDALLNRRVGIQIKNIAGLLRRKQIAVDSTHGFLWLRRWLRFVRRVLVHESMLLARLRGPFPQLGANALIKELAPHYGLHNARILMRGRFLRHRHLLALSPFSLFPEEFSAAEEKMYISLLPVLACADVITMHGSDPRSLLSMQGWEQLLRLVAVLASRQPSITCDNRT